MSRHHYDDELELAFLDPLQERREFLKLMGASLGLAGLTACVKQPEEHIYPHVRAPEHLVPGRPRFYATSLSRSGVGSGVLVESHEGRPTKIEGNDAHPATGGGTDVWMQADVLSLYDPDRSQLILRRGQPSTWSRFLEEVLPAFGTPTKGRRTALLTGNVTSPTLAAQIEGLKAHLPELRWFQWEAVHQDERRRATTTAFGRPLDVVYDFTKADVVVALDADPLFAEPGSVRYARDAARRRRDPARFSRWYVVEPSPTCTGTFADHRFRAKRTAIGDWVRSIASELGVIPGGAAIPEVAPIVRDLKKAGSRALVVIGPHQPAEVQALAFAINQRLGARDETFTTIAPVAAAPVSHVEELAALTAAMNAGEIESLLVLDKNPIFDAPADLEFEAAYAKVPLRIQVGLYDDETANMSHWHLPSRHALESWSDIKAYDGTVSIVQPLIRPLYSGHSAHELIALLMGGAGQRDHDIVRAHYEKEWGAQLESKWRRVLHDGFVEGSAHAPVSTAPRTAALSKSAPADLEITFAPDPTLWDGSYANNAWLLELPKPITRLSWDNAALMSPATAARLGVKSEDLVTLTVGDRATKAAVYVQPGQADDSVALSLGSGRRRGGRLALEVGFDAQAIRPAKSSWAAPVKVTKTGETYRLASVQEHHKMEGRHLVRQATIAEYAANKDFAKEPDKKVLNLSMYPEPHPNQQGDQWGMSINLNACNGCNACVVACQSENNIPVVGKEEVGRGREMHWLRIDSYFEGDDADPDIHTQPVTCMHCENAPCEVVCPVNATVHSPSGINEMVYNRCVGTRYCSNNCPYKVRRFNFHLYQDWETPSLEPLRNPDVSVRSRGVMEKCTFCIQRIQQARITARKEDRDVRDGEIVTACQGACPTEAITFGNVASPESAVSREKADPRDYTLLREVNTKPRVSYTAKLKNSGLASNRETKE